MHFHFFCVIVSISFWSIYCCIFQW